ncbi:MAG: BMP family ABC transporter substrate-binding protein [Bacillus sp. (in: firmicutes)]
MKNWTRKLLLLAVTIVFLPLTGSCGVFSSEQKLQSVGLLMPETIHDQVWGTKGYRGLLQIRSSFDVDVYYREDIDSKALVEDAVNELNDMGVNLVIGHGDFYAETFNEIASDYPDIHFVSLNGNATEPNTTSLLFEGYAMGYFGGMIASEMSKTNNIGVIGAYSTQGEITGFIDGAKWMKNDMEIHSRYVGDWDDVDQATAFVEELEKKNVDVYYPAGDGFNVPVIEKVKENGKYVIGYVSEQQDFGERTVLTSTIQHVDKLILLAASEFNKGKLESGNLSFDFQEDVISMGKYSPLIPEDFQEKMDRYIEEYIKTGSLPGKGDRDE